MRKPHVCIIGASAVDLTGRSYATIHAAESNPGCLRVSFGGVGRNIAENLARLKIPVRMITVLGDDHYGKQLLDHAASAGIDMHAHIVAGGISPCYLSIQDPQGELAIAVAAMDLLEQLTIDVIRNHETVIGTAALCVLDTNLSPDVIGFLLQHFPTMDFCLDLVSMAKAGKVMPWLGRFCLIKANRAEAEMLSGIPLGAPSSLHASADYFLGAGVQQIFISLGRDGLFYSDGGQHGSLTLDAAVKPLSTSGAGDAMMAGLIFGRYHGLDLASTASIAMAASRITLAHPDAVNPDINPRLLQHTKETVRHASMG